MAEKASGSFWRRIDWRVWTHSYLAETPEVERIAWVRPCGRMRRGNQQAVTPNEDERFPAQVRDISLGGLVLMVNEKFESGTLLKVEVVTSHGESTIELLARVIQVASQTQRAFIITCCFAKELDDDDLRAFGAERVRATEDDGRDWIRYACEAETSVQCVVAAESKQIKAKVLNISAGGFAIRVPQPFEVGTLLSLSLVTNDKVSRSIMARVVHAHKQPEGDWILGCTFVAELSDNALEALM